MAKSEAWWQVMNLIVTMKDGMMGMIGMVGMGLDGMGDFGLSGWWFGTFFIFPYIGNKHPN